MSDASYDVFISYRRESGSAEARLIRTELAQRGLRVFLDVTDLRRGFFDDALLRCISATPSFVLVLSPHALDRCAHEDDWLRQEIVYAIRTDRNIIPVILPGFTFPPTPEACIKSLPRHQGVEYSHIFFEAMVDRIAESVGADKAERERGAHETINSERVTVEKADAACAAPQRAEQGGVKDKNVEPANVGIGSKKKLLLLAVTAVIAFFLLIRFSWRPSSQYETSGQTHDTIGPDVSLAATLISSPDGFPGGASGSSYWPARFTFFSIDKHTGKVTGKAEWYTSGAVGKIEGTLSGTELTITDAVPGSNAGPHHVYKLSPDGPHRLVGKWFLGSASGPTWIILETASSSLDSSRPKPGSALMALTHGFEFQLKQCFLSEYTVICDLDTVNHSEEVQLTFGSNGSSGQIEAYDDSGNHYIVDAVQVANEVTDNPVKVTNHFMISGTPTHARVVFLRVNEHATKLTLLKFPCLTQLAGGFTAEFRDIPLRR